ncbi:MAG: recombinase family protein [Bacteroidetes bacterium]|nr:recombinase family protein [Bacteroidota bacterium]
MQNIFMAFAEFERNIISERTRESMYQRAKLGQWNGGSAPLGYDVQNKKLEINFEEAKLVNKIHDYYSKTPSCLEVAKRLKLEGKRMKSLISIKKMKVVNRFRLQNRGVISRKPMYLAY